MSGTVGKVPVPESGVGHIVVAIDGPAASGKSSVARCVARRLAFVYVNTGAMYRAVTWYVLDRGLSPVEPASVAEAISRAEIHCGVHDAASTFTIDGVDPTPFLLTEQVNRSVSQVAAVPEVRTRLAALQRVYADGYDVVMEGRDIGSAVFPDTPYKFYIDASVEVRANRRALQGLQDSIAARDRQDTSRRSSPLIIAEDAHVIDSSNLTIDGVVGEIVGRLKLKGFAVPDFPPSHT